MRLARWGVNGHVKENPRAAVRARRCHLRRHDEMIVVDVDMPETLAILVDLERRKPMSLHKAAAWGFDRRGNGLAVAPPLMSPRARVKREANNERRANAKVHDPAPGNLAVPKPTSLRHGKFLTETCK
jgi:hypothetical protein